MSLSRKPLNQQQARIQTENELQALFRQQHEFKRRTYPEWATYDGDHRFDDRLTDLSHEAWEQRYLKYRSFLRDLLRLNSEWLPERERLNYRLFEQMLNEELRFFELDLHLLAIDQQEGMHLHFPQLVEIQPLNSYEQYEQYFSRLRSFEKQVNDTIANLKLALERQRFLPRTVVLQSLKQMAELAACPLEQMPLYQPVLQHAQHLAPGLRERVAAMAERLIVDSVQPAYGRLHDFVRAEFLPACAQDDGLARLPGGEEVYAYWQERHTHAGQSAQEIHQLGCREVERLDAELAELLERLDLPRDLENLRQVLAESEDYYYADTETLMRDYQQMLDDAQSTLPRLFHHLPSSDCILRPIESWRAEAAPQAYYYPPPQNLSRPGVFYVNTSDLSQRPRYSMMALTLHEAVPGHHLQLARALELKSLPDFRYHLESTSFVEGWALYAEALGHELELYQEPLQELGALSFELWRACRLVVDTGLHALGWSREQAVGYFRDHSLQSELDIQSEVDRYLALPGQALAYKVGELRLRDLRRQAEQNLGSRFDLRDFHEVLLEEGSLPLSEVTRRVQDWMTAA